MNTTRKSNKSFKGLVLAVLLAVTFILTTASSCSSPECDVTGKDTALTTCAYQIVTGK